jgi:hypothetical protein
METGQVTQEHIMSRHHGNERVKAGFYVNRDSWTVKTISGKAGGVLPGDASSRWLRVPTLLMLVFAPLMGAAYAMFLPFIGIALFLQFIARKSVAAVKSVGQNALGATAPTMAPGAAYFEGQKTKKAEPTGDATVEARLDAIEREADTREQ